MDILNTFRISSSALKAQATRLDTISANMANAETTSTPEGGAYRKKSVYFQTTPVNFQDQLNSEMSRHAQGVEVAQIVEDESPFRKVYDPQHPDASEDGYVEMPNVDIMKEMVDMMSATRSYQANVSAIESAKKMALKALEIGQ